MAWQGRRKRRRHAAVEEGEHSLLGSESIEVKEEELPTGKAPQQQ